MNTTALTMRGVLAALILASVVAICASVAPRPAEAASHCVRIQRQGSLETLVNVCRQCVVATTSRARPGTAPVNREYNVQANSTFPLTNYGPGSTRVSAERLCPGEAGAQQDLIKSLNSSEQQTQNACIGMERASGGVALVNRCTICRVAAIERYSADRSTKSRAFLMVASRSRTAVPSDGYASVGLLSELACPK